jgi:hypothetical protein
MAVGLVEVGMAPLVAVRQTFVAHLPCHPGLSSPVVVEVVMVVITTEGVAALMASLDLVLLMAMEQVGIVQMVGRQVVQVDGAELRDSWVLEEMGTFLMERAAAEDISVEGAAERVVEVDPVL